MVSSVSPDCTSYVSPADVSAEADVAVGDTTETAGAGDTTGEASGGRCGLGAGTAATAVAGTAVGVGAAAPAPQPAPKINVATAQAPAVRLLADMRRELRVRRTP